MLKISAFCIPICLVFFLPVLNISGPFAAEPPKIQIEKLRFFDWETGSEPQEIAKKTCHLQLTGFTQDRIFLSMRLSMVKASPATGDQNALTIIKITATKVHQEDFSDALPIVLSEAWLETSTVTTLGRLKKIMDEKPHFLGGMSGVGLFNGLLRGIKKDGLVIGYRSESSALARVFAVAAPSAHFFEGLKTCLSKGIATF